MLPQEPIWFVRVSVGITTLMKMPRPIFENRELKSWKHRVAVDRKNINAYGIKRCSDRVPAFFLCFDALAVIQFSSCTFWHFKLFI